jgi:hypothetical protein
LIPHTHLPVLRPLGVQCFCLSHFRSASDHVDGHHRHHLVGLLVQHTDTSPDHIPVRLRLGPSRFADPGSCRENVPGTNRTGPAEFDDGR